MKTTASRNIDEYISEFPKDIQKMLHSVRNTIRKAAPAAGETISYAIPTFTLNGMLVHFAAFRNHIGFYPTPSGIEEFKNELSSYDVSKGTVRFPIGKPLPLRLIRDIVKFRVLQNSEKTKPKSGK